MEKITQFLTKVVKEASLIINKKPEIFEKDGKGDLVTTYDFEIEKFLTKKLNENYPKFDILSEEFNSKSKVGKNYFTIDPIDGTVNFSNNIPLWGIQVACIKDDEIVSAVMYFSESDEMFYADKSGAFCNGKKLKMQETPANKNLAGLLNSKNTKFTSNTHHYRYLGCACATFAWLLKNYFSSVFFTTKNIKQDWDYTPGAFIALQAGGKIAKFKNNYVIAATQEIAEKVLEYGK